MTSLDNPIEKRRRQLVQRHLVEGWGSLSLFLLLGVALEIFLAFKVDLYTRADHTTFRLMWRLAHAHGTLLGVLHLGFAFSLTKLSDRAFPQPAGFLSGCMTGGSLLIPAGFFLGGLGAQGGDPGASIALVPMGAVLLIFCSIRLAIGLRADPKDSSA